MPDDLGVVLVKIVKDAGSAAAEKLFSGLELL